MTLSRLAGILGLVGLAAAALTAAGASSDPDAFYQAYLASFYYWAGLSIGSLAVLLLHHLVGGRWGEIARRPLEAAVGTLPLVAVLFVPIALGLESLFLWSRPEALAADSHLAEKARIYLNPPAFRARAAAYFALWLALAFVLVYGSRRDERTGTGVWTRRMRAAAGPGLLLVFVSSTFASIDWVMSLDPYWSSTGFGVVQIAGQGVTGMALAVLAVLGLGPVEPRDRNDLGSLLFAFVLFWIYVSFMQYLIVWSGNLPEESVWYLARVSGGWEWVAVFLPVFHFALPFAFLLSRRAKAHPRLLGGVALSVLVAHWFEVAWTVLPAFRPGDLRVAWLDATAPLAMGGLWLAAFLWQIRSRPLPPTLEGASS